MYDKIQLGVTDVRKFIEFVKFKYGYDFKDYALTSLRRRIQKYMFLNNIPDVAQVLVKLEMAENFDKFLIETSIEVTELFRDPPFWRVLRDDILPSLDKLYSKINVWIPDCSTGDDIYSLLILAHEINLTSKLHITATNISDNILNNAKNPSYSMSKLELAQHNYQRFNDKGKLDNYIKLEPFSFSIDQRFVSNVNFVSHSLTDENLLGDYHIIISRNILLYFNSSMHDKIVSKFNSSLHRNGFMCLGTQETIEFCKDVKRFTVYNQSESIYKKNDTL
ncbi:MAG: CheR family methyltransferase [Bacteroidota bacterium]